MPSELYKLRAEYITTFIDRWWSISDNHKFKARSDLSLDACVHLDLLYSTLTHALPYCTLQSTLLWADGLCRLRRFVDWISRFWSFGRLWSRHSFCLNLFGLGISLALTLAFALGCWNIFVINRFSTFPGSFLAWLRIFRFLSLFFLGTQFFGLAVFDFFLLFFISLRTSSRRSANSLCKSSLFFLGFCLRFNSR